MSTNISIFTNSFINRENILNKVINKSIHDSSIQIENLIIDGINLNLWLQPQFVNIDTNKNILTNFVNLEKSDDFIVLFIFTLKYMRITETFIDELKILKNFLNDDISKVQFIYCFEDDTKLSSNDKQNIKELVLQNINSNIKTLNNDIHYIFDINNIKKNISSIIQNIYTLKKNGMNKMIEPHTAYYGADNVFDDRLLTSISRDI